jgi:hypothetical protein
LVLFGLNSTPNPIANQTGTDESTGTGDENERDARDYLAGQMRTLTGSTMLIAGWLAGRIEYGERAPS